MVKRNRDEAVLDVTAGAGMSPSVRDSFLASAEFPVEAGKERCKRNTDDRTRAEIGGTSAAGTSDARHQERNDERQHEHGQQPRDGRDQCDRNARQNALEVSHLLRLFKGSWGRIGEH